MAFFQSRSAAKLTAEQVPSARAIIPAPQPPEAPKSKSPGAFGYETAMKKLDQSAPTVAACRASIDTWRPYGRGFSGTGAVKDGREAHVSQPLPHAGRVSPRREHSLNHRTGTEEGAEGDCRAVL